jgi:hypothetical protein
MPADGDEGLSQTELLRLDYQQTTDLLRTLTDVRFKLLAPSTGCAAPSRSKDGLACSRSTAGHGQADCSASGPAARCASSLAELGRIHQLPQSHSIPAGAAPEPPAITADR